jgi:threonine dehydrogenase-like Zn-dependent dehydrogenase
MASVPDAIADDVVVLADPWSVSFHAITRNPPPVGGRVLVYGAGALGSTATAILTQLYDCEVGVVARWDAQADLARRRGATVFAAEPREDLVEAVAAWSGGTLRRPWEGLPVCYPGQVDVVYDTVGAGATVEVAMRVLAERGTWCSSG